MSMLIVMLGVFSLAKMPTDMLPEVDIPVVAVVDQGDRLAVASGLEAGDTVVQNPSDRLTEGLHVEPVVPKPAS